MVTVWKSKKEYIPLKAHQQVKFIKDSRYDWEFKKGDLGVIDRVISPYPSATDTIYTVVHTKSKTRVWVVGEDIASLDQLKLSDSDLEDHNICGHSYFEDGIVCLLGAGHGGDHKAESGLLWDDDGNTPWDDWAGMI